MPGGKNFRPYLKTGKEQGARRWSGNVFQSLGAQPTQNLKGRTVSCPSV